MGENEDQNDFEDGDADVHHGDEHDSELEEFGRRKKRKKYKWASNN